MLYADDEDALNSGEASLDHTFYYDRLALVCTDSALENPLTSRYFAELVRAGDQPNAAPIISLGLGELFYQRKDRLCRRLRDGECLDFRNGEAPALESLVRELSAPKSVLNPSFLRRQEPPCILCARENPVAEPP